MDMTEKQLSSEYKFRGKIMTARVDEVSLPYLTDGHGNTLYTLYSSGTLRLGDGT